MLSKISILVCSIVALPTLLPAADLQREYEQVRSIALRDAKVRAAYAAADRKLADRIVEIDPTLKGYVPGKSSAKSKPAPAPAPATKPSTKTTAAAKPQPAKKAAKQDSETYKRSHVVQSGETIGSIAARYRVDSGELARINHISNAKKLPVGQVLALPNKSAKAPAPKKTASASQKSWWDELKSSY
jgi:LysM repeat protein